MMRSLTLFTTVLGSVLLTSGAARPAFAQWDSWDPWLLGSGYRTSYYAPSFYGGYWTGYAPSGGCDTCCYGPAVPSCGCASACSPCGNGGCASGSCGMNAAPGGTPRPIAEPEHGRSGKDTPIPGRKSPSTGTWDPADPKTFDPPAAGTGRSGTGTNDAPKPKPFGSGRSTGNEPADDGFRTRPGTGGRGTGTGTELEGNPDPFKTNKVQLNDPDLPEVPEKSPAAPMDVKEEAPVDAANPLDGQVTNRPVITRERQAMRSRFTAPSLARTPVRPAINWSATPVDGRIARQ